MELIYFGVGILIIGIFIGFLMDEFFKWTNRRVVEKNIIKFIDDHEKKHIENKKLLEEISTKK